jgi:ribose transport system ATP-binding protein
VSERPVLIARGIGKRFPGVQALDGVDLTLRAGEIHAVVGENGAGKSTLMKVLAGIESADRGEIEVEGQVVRIASTRRASELGIALIHQELCLADNLSAGANIFLGREPRRYGLIDHLKIRERSGAALRRIGADYPPESLVEGLTIGQQQGVEIAKALSQEAKVLILDEPTSSLSLAESEHLFEVLRTLRAKGVSIVYISHRLSEVCALADRVAVLRDGRNSGELQQDEITRDSMVRLMIGRDVTLDESEGCSRSGEPVLHVQGLSTSAHPRSAVSLSVSAGEIVGIAGLVGAGRSELLQAIFGIDIPIAGKVHVARNRLPCGNPRASIAAGIGFVPEDRKQHGLFLELGLRENIGIASLNQYAKRGFVNTAIELTMAQDMIEALSIKTSGTEQLAGLLSGGNQQKVVLAKWLATRPRLLLLDEPTRGIDVGARQEIYAILRSLAKEGVAILFASSELEEVLTLSDRVMVMHAGSIRGELTGHQKSEDAVMQLATGRSTTRLQA